MKPFLNLLLLVLTLLLLLASYRLGSDSKYDLPYHGKRQIAVRVIRDLSYGLDSEKEANLLDLYLPLHLRKGLPLVVWIHGGGWRMGDKNYPPFYLLTQHGFAVASINYRLSNEAKFPAQIHDCSAALSWLSKHAQEFDIDGNRIGIWGASAGGHLVALIGTARNAEGLPWADQLKQSAKNVRAVCDWAGPADLLEIMTKRRPVALAGMVSDFLPDQSKDNWARQASPTTYVSKNGPAFLVMHGDIDMVVPVEQSIELSRMLKAKGADCSLVILPGVGHILDSAKNRDKVLHFFQRTLNQQ